jgi:hypothetical protein
MLWRKYYSKLEKFSAETISNDFSIIKKLNLLLAPVLKGPGIYIGLA